MTTDDRSFHILLLLATHYTLTASQIRRLVFRPDQDQDGRQTRRLLAQLCEARLINKARMEVVNPLHGSTARVYFPSRAGCELLAVKTGDVRYLLTPTQTPQWQNLRHWTILSDVRITIDAAIRRQSALAMPLWFNEFDTVNKDAERPEDRYRLYTVCRREPRRIVCCPDAAFLLRKGAAAKAYYVELETGSNPPQKAAAEKTPGYASLAAQKLHLRHFPDAPGEFGVLVFAPDAPWRDVLRTCFRQKEGAHLYKFAALTELTPETFLHAPIFYVASDDTPRPLVKGGGQ
jgi:hypothetical protein